MNTTILSIADFIRNPQPEADATPAVLAALRACRNTSEPVLLRFPKGEYHFWPDRAYEQYCFISNNDHGLKRIVFPLRQMSRITVDGEGSAFVFHGRVLPFLIEESRDIAIRNVSIDYDRPFFSQGEIIGAGETHIDVSINKEQFPYRVRQGQVQFCSGNWESEGIVSTLPFDPAAKAPSYKMRDTYAKRYPITAVELEEGVVRLQGKFSQVHKQGDHLIIKHERRLNPAVAISGSTSISLEGIDVYHAATMAFVAQNSSHIQLKRSSVRLKEGTERLVSACADATHFVNCSGHIQIEDCVFENQMDDAVNVHGIYMRISEVLSGREAALEFKHFQQYGVQLFKGGDKVRFVDPLTMLPVAQGVVEDVEAINQEYMKVTFRDPLPAGVESGLNVENISAVPDLTIRGCRSGRNRARGFLITTPGKVVIENNEFYTGGAAIKISGDCNFWYESGAVRDVAIRHNQFVDCGYGPWGKSVVDIDPEVPEEGRGQGCYHTGITIENNTFRVIERALLYALSVDGLHFRNNTVELTRSYPPFKQLEHVLTLEHCRGVEVSGNKLTGIEDSRVIRLGEGVHKDQCQVRANHFEFVTAE